MRENEKTFFHLLRNKHPVKWIVVAHRQPRHCLRMGEADRQLGNSRFTTESSHLLGGHRNLVRLYGMLDSHFPY